VHKAAFYGDDLTGSTDALAQFHLAGLSGLLVMSPDALELAKGYDVAGIAGIARSLPAAEMEREVRPALTALRDATERVVQYKVCSTADSSPALGSIGRAIEIGRSVFGAAPVPVLVAQPGLGRYTAFGNHFAVENDAVYRLDRQPTMSRHPATPIGEADLRRHLGGQTRLTIGSVDLRAYDGDLDERYRAAAADDPGAIVFDAIDDRQLRAAAEAMLARAARFVVGSGGLSFALGSALGGPHAAPVARPAGPVPTVLVVSGSASPRTASQIRWARAHGWRCLEGDPSTTAVLAGLRAGPGVVVAGAGDLGPIVAGALRAGAVRRVVVAGGDTAGRVMRAVRADALEIVSVIEPGLPLGRLRAADPDVDGAEVLLKGGQLGPDDLFDRVRAGA
jgi:3-oxoisoapionate kinase